MLRRSWRSSATASQVTRGQTEAPWTSLLRIPGTSGGPTSCARTLFSSWAIGAFAQRHGWLDLVSTWRRFLPSRTPTSATDTETELGGSQHDLDLDSDHTLHPLSGAVRQPLRTERFPDCGGDCIRELLSKRRFY